MYLYGAQIRTDVLPCISLIPVFGGTALVYLWPRTSSFEGGSHGVIVYDEAEDSILTSGIG